MTETCWTLLAPDELQWLEWQLAMEKVVRVVGDGHHANALRQAINRFGLQLLCTVDVTRNTNQLVAPLAVSVLLGMAAAGAATDSEVASELGSVLRYDCVGSLQAVQEAYRVILAELRSEASRNGLHLFIASSCWLPNTALESYGRVLQRSFNASAQTWVDNDAINKWANQMGKPGNGAVVGAAPLNPTGAVLAGTCVCQGWWGVPFDRQRTAEGIFHCFDGPTPVLFMTMDHHNALYTKTAGCQIIELPYGAGRFVATVCLPNQQGPEALNLALRMLQSGGWKQLPSILRPTPLLLSLPRFVVDAEATDLTSSLREMGLKESLQPDACYLRMTRTADTSVSTVLHQAVFTLDEGRRPPGVAEVPLSRPTAGVARASSALTVVDMERVAFDRPFVLLVSDKELPTLLLAGVIVRPTPAAAARRTPGPAAANGPRT
eukprot:CAMPEP_0114539180 /NCGR_PEP_ID=MMETSP0114-20121206/101_1 /TAXON_ID=31324 /ORGANISM="Goniomonas sp, Strain m" /LENGTH=434 /DNA_ID=CAMNT_0001723267 /DNA_START=295 /DNA_END=1599 /DNA_ORIENTATION=-